jgi:HNH endonuclease
MPRPIIPLEIRFWEKVNKTSTCWIWEGARKGRDNDYGCIMIDYKSTYAHIVGYELKKGPIPKGMTLDHLCRNRLCVRASHLEPVTGKINTLRGLGPTAINARMTHCNRGHEFTKENTYVGNNGSRQCKACRRENYAKKQIGKSPKPRKPRKLKTVCKRGHDWTISENVFLRTDGRQQCKVCHSVAVARNNAKKRKLV